MMAGNAWSEYATDIYRQRVAEQQARVDAYANGYPTEESAFYSEIEPRVTFKDTLKWLKGTWQQR